MGVRDEIRPPFTEAVVVVLREMAGAEAIPRDEGDAPPADLAATIRLQAETEGRLVLEMPSATAEELARRILVDVIGAPDAGMIRDCVGEVANVVAGQAKTLLFGNRHHFTFSTPVVSAGPEAGRDDPAGDCLVIAFDSDAGPLTLRVGFAR